MPISHICQAGGTVKLKTIFVIGDDDADPFSVRNILSADYRLYAFHSAKGMFALLEHITPDLIILDTGISGLDGIETFKILKDNNRNAEIPVIFLADNRDTLTETIAFDMGALDFIRKPFSAHAFASRIKNHLNIEDLNRERMVKLKKLQSGIVSILAGMVENRDTYTGTHIERTTKYLKILLEAMMIRKVYFDEISHWNIETVISSVRLHDIGKIVISDLLLNKKGKLTEEEYETMKTHTAKGESIIESIIEESGDGYFLQHAKLFAGYHHERWDGTGYPYGLKGEDIPLQGRIMAVVDVFDALVSERPYKPAFPFEKAVQVISENMGKQFDPVIVNVFMEVSNLFKDKEEEIPQI
jgi:putative two-component system response regulator